ncbi:uncharacterized protein GGS22DRAFT_11318 [Annulohypoxylon maeteangense]|uniref:uncharacterized protein n=1 Tax=Annulohypoxylon maeteangense TaxID=1927788 RepID=UPI0020081757|nr:uncharacterized protein GGS22DRAFT_11318 [Annulohypoxylon maeteangense]KAI0890278.1 hypothetical protein GGS22DRAFT_11318 [Annulohypoxylon maeteangense]
MPKFEFVNVACPGDVKQHSTAIRRHVMKDIGKARRKPRTKKGKVIMGEGSSSATTDQDEAQPSSPSRVVRLPSPRMDGTLHTIVFPINMDQKRLNLIQYVVDEARNTYRPFRFPWLTMGLSDIAAWHITLANAVVYRGMKPGEKKSEFTNLEAMKWYTLSLASITKRLADPAESESEGLIIAVTGFVCHDASIGNFERFAIHIEGLQRLINKKGGLHALSSPFLRLMISWLDLAGATYFNSKPRFHIPRDSITQIDTSNNSQYLRQLLQSWDADCPTLGDIMSAMNATAAAAAYINQNQDTPNFWIDDVKIARVLSPAFHEILTLEGIPLPDDPLNPEYSGIAAREAFRRAALIFLAAIKIRMGAGALEMGKHLEAFRQISQLPLVNWGLVAELNLWAHIISAMQEESPSRAWHVLTIVGIMENIGLQTGNQAMDLARGVIWVDAIDGGKSDSLCREIDNYLEATLSQRLENIPVDPNFDMTSGNIES